MEINQVQGSAIIISANGMCTAGRIKHHLKHNLWRPGASIVIVGFQGQGTTGRQIVDRAKAVTVFGEKIVVRAKVFTIGGFSAHGDQADLLGWVGHFAKKSRPRVFVIHGEPKASKALAAAIRERFPLDVYVPRRGEVLTLEPREGVPEVLPEAPPVDLRANMFSLIANLEAELARLKEQIAKREKGPSAKAVEKLSSIRDELQSVVSE
jgi:metallo-beta-lactamase family protein